MNRKFFISLSVYFSMIVFSFFTLQADESKILGLWVLNDELTEELKPKPRKSRSMGGFGGVTVAAGGIGIPLPGGGMGGPAAAAASLKFPTVLECEGFELGKKDDKVTLSCEDGSRRDFYIGNKHGRKTSLTSKTLRESYSSTSRTVKHAFKLDRDDNLIVTVRIKAKGGEEQVYVRAFSKEVKDENVTEIPITEERIP